MPIQEKFIGEYSFDGGRSWKPLEDDTKLSAYDGELILRGNFEYVIAEEVILNFYLDHITINIYVNGEHELFDSRTEYGLTSSSCCRQWIQWITPKISEGDIVEIHLENPHKFGNKTAYDSFLNSIYMGPEYLFDGYMLKTGKPYRIIGFVLLVAAVMLVSVSLAFRLLGIGGGKRIGNLGFLALFFGGFLALDTIDVSLWSSLNVFNTYGLRLCIMLAAFMILISASECMKTGVHKISAVLCIVSAAADVIIMLLSLFGVWVIYDTSILWLAVSIPAFAVMLGCCVYELSRKPTEGRTELVSHIVLIIAVLADFVNWFAGLLPSGIFSKTVFLLLFLFNLVRIIKKVPADYRAAREAEKMAAELADSRAAIMLSQIQPHFLYNSLNSIYYLCGKDPDAARQAISDFSDYLRGNMASLSRKCPITFSEELKHLKIYLSLEKMRFDDKLNIVYDIQTEDFMIPALTVQPIVENSVKYGICSSEKGGTVRILSRELADRFEVEITDDGIGFDVNEKKNDGRTHVGIENVRNRLKKMVNGTLEITSEKGKGTIAVIKIPKEVNTDEDNCG